MPKKSKSSKSSKKRKSRKARNLRSSEATNVSEESEVAQQTPDEYEGASIPTESCKFNTPVGSDSEIYVYYENSLTPSPIENRSLSPRLKSTESLQCSLMSPESLESRIRSKSVEPSGKLEFVESPVLKVCSEHSLTSEMRAETEEILLIEFARSRRDHFLYLFQKAEKVTQFMESLSSMRKENKDTKIRVANNRWKQKDSSDWFRLLSLWDTVMENMTMLISVLRFTYMYDDFDVYACSLITLEDFYAFICDLEEVYQNLDKLLKVCRNCWYKFCRFCASNNESTYLRGVDDYRSKISHFYKKLKVEVDKFRKVREASICYSDV